MKLKKINELKGSFIPLTSDVVSKAIFHFDEDITKKFLSILLGINVEKFEFLENELPALNAYEYHLTTDLLFLVNDKLYVNIEINRVLFENVQDKSLCYFAKYISLRVTRGDDIKDVENGIVQINLNAITKKNDKPEKTVVFYIEEEQKVLTDNVLMKLYNIEKFRELYYNNNRDKKTILLTLFASKNIEELKETIEYLLDIDKRELFVRRYLDMCNDPRVISAFEKEQTDKMVYYRSIENATNEGKSLGFVEGKNVGIEKSKMDIAKKLLDENASYELISKVTGISIKELEIMKNQ